IHSPPPFPTRRSSDLISHTIRIYVSRMCCTPTRECSGPTTEQKTESESKKRFLLGKNSVAQARNEGRGLFVVVRRRRRRFVMIRSEEHTSELQSLAYL